MEHYHLTQLATYVTYKIDKTPSAITAYCDRYCIAFTRDAMRSDFTPEERWMEQFGNDPMWGGVIRKDDVRASSRSNALA